MQYLLKLYLFIKERIFPVIGLILENIINPRDFREDIIGFILFLFQEIIFPYIAYVGNIWPIFLIQYLMALSARRVDDLTFSMFSLFFGLLALFQVVELPDVIVCLFTISTFYIIYLYLEKHYMVGYMLTSGLIYIFLVFMCLTRFMYARWQNVRGYLLVIGMKFVELSYHSSNHTLTGPIHFFGYLLNPSSFLMGGCPSLPLYISIRDLPAPKNKRWYLTLLRTILKSFTFYTLSKKLLPMLVLDNDKSCLAMYVKSVQLRTLHYAMAYLAEFGTIVSGMNIYYPYHNRNRKFNFLNFLDVELGGSINTALIFFENFVAPVYDEYRFCIYLLMLLEGIYRPNKTNYVILMLLTFFSYGDEFTLKVIMISGISYVQRRLCREFRRFIMHQKCSAGCCVIALFQKAKPKTLAAKIFHIFMVACNHVYLTFFFLDIADWEYLNYAHLFVFTTQLMALTMLKFYHVFFRRLYSR